MERLEKGALFEQCRQWHDDHLRVYFGKRDLGRALDMYCPQVIGVGTGRSEYGHTTDLIHDVIRRDIKSFPEPIEYAVKDRGIHQLTDDVVVCQALLDLTLPLDAHRVRLRDMRHTMTIRSDDDGQWRICHVHVSFPTDIHGDEESWPLKEIEEISAVVDEMIASRTSDLTAAYRKLEHMAIHDRLTGLFNRIRIDEKLDQEILRATRYGSPFSLILFDIDEFKGFNDRHGHLAGDQVLCCLANILADGVRDTDLAGRWGGEEFIVILPETGIDSAHEMAERIRKEFSSRCRQIDDRIETELTISCGVGEFRPGDDADSLFERTDRALYEAKKQGRNRTALAD